MALPVIRPMAHADVERTAAAIHRSGWGDRLIKMRWVVDHAGCRPIVADAAGTIVGTGITTLNGAVAWIGTIWVEPSWRGRGLGRALTNATIEDAEAAGCRTLLLVATEAGRPLYEKLGFEVQTEYRTVEARGITGKGDPRVRPFRASDLPAMAALDATATGEDRAHLLRALATPDGTRCRDREDGTLGGFVVRAPWGGGATIAPQVDDALAILHARRIAAGPDKRVRAGVVELNRAGLRSLLDDGWADAWHAPRMIRGDMPAWRPEAIWGQFDHAMG